MRKVMEKVNQVRRSAWKEKDSVILKVKQEVDQLRVKINYVLLSKSGEGYLDTVIKLLIAIVLGALLLAGLYALFGDVVMPRLEKEVNEMFNYGG